MSEFKVGDFTYRAKSMDAFMQLDVMSKLAPLLSAGAAELIPFFINLKKDGAEKIENVGMSAAMAALGPVATAMSSMTADDRRFVIGTCLDLCERKGKDAERWDKIWNAAANRAMFDDINNDISVMMKITLSVLQGTFQRFFPAGLSELIGGAIQ